MRPSSVTGAGTRASWAGYAPSWVDRLQHAAERLPWPAWLTYAIIFVLLVLTETLWKWSAGTYPAGTVYPYHLVVFGTGIFGFALVHHLDRAASRALDALRPVLSMSDDEVEAFRYRITTMPAWPVAAASLLAVAFGVFQRFAIVASGVEAFRYAESGGLYYFENAVILLGDWSVIGAYLYHAIRQLHLVDTLYRRHAAIDLFHVRPLHAFSAFAAQHAVGILVVGYAWVAAFPAAAGAPALRLMFGFIGLLVMLAFATFLWPIWGAHQRLVGERERRKQQAHRDLAAVTQLLHADVAAGDYGQMDGLSKAMAGLREELALLDHASTWPWQTNTLRGFLTAVLLPLFLWGTQQLLGRLLLS